MRKEMGLVRGRMKAGPCLPALLLIMAAAATLPLVICQVTTGAQQAGEGRPQTPALRTYYAFPVPLLLRVTSRCSCSRPACPIMHRTSCCQ